VSVPSSSLDRMLCRVEVSSNEAASAKRWGNPCLRDKVLVSAAADRKRRQ
jgi:hypothetical protein